MDIVDSSWVITAKDKMNAVIETFDFESLQFVNIELYDIYTSREYLEKLNARPPSPIGRGKRLKIFSVSVRSRRWVP